MRITFCHEETLKKAIDADVELEERLFSMSGCSTGTEQCWQTLWIYSTLLPRQVYVEEEKRKKIDRMKEVFRGNDCSVETYQSLKLRKDSV